jgi:hypothetical protein
MPPLNKTAYLAHWLGDLGWCKSGGMGMAPIDWADVRNWSEMMNPDLARVESLLLMEASRAYVGQNNASRDPSCPAPYIDESKLPPGAVKRGG